MSDLAGLVHVEIRLVGTVEDVHVGPESEGVHQRPGDVLDMSHRFAVATVADDDSAPALFSSDQVQLGLWRSDAAPGFLLEGVEHAGMVTVRS